MKKEFIFSALITIVSLLIAFAAGFLAHSYLYPPELELPILSQARDIIDNHGYYPVPDEPALEYGMIHGMVGALDDPYASFVEPVQHELDTNTYSGEFGGIGAEVSKDEDNKILLFPLADSPAREAGIQDGDIIIAVDGAEITPDTTIEELISMVRGPVGEQVSITVYRPSDQSEYAFSIKRASFTIPSVSWRPLDNYPEIGLIDINLVSATTPDEVIEAVDDLKANGVNYFILDLQGNAGGLLTGGIDVARLFLKDGEVITQQYRGQKPEKFTVTRPGPLTDIPLVVLIDHGSASAAEIIAGALQANERAPLIGSPSFGKNTIQLIFTMEDESSIHVTSAVWWLPGQTQDDEFKLFPDIQADPAAVGYEQVLQLAVNYFLSNKN